MPPRFDHAPSLSKQTIPGAPIPVGALGPRRSYAPAAVGVVVHPGGAVDERLIVGPTAPALDAFQRVQIGAQLWALSLDAGSNQLNPTVTGYAAATSGGGLRFHGRILIVGDPVAPAGPSPFQRRQLSRYASVIADLIARHALDPASLPPVPTAPTTGSGLPTGWTGPRPS
ncbi:hypothetical protein A5788_04610 [Gordonia sp. 852002-50816_SCH5313054-c]|uniref:hypothetical protein n=1 Tax=unclassified Gordonia (in: high G+C Gram-positive bacteria) TaxID=2657482 RepID=UPI0007EAE490|nr:MULTISPECIES: hypothetical protein [unclassified Gordonia (in: high G+C Gram-positive bacteria)]OBC05889.1 hypothetical protein A5786_10815 [Gordonia sp. 852002-50816_SCH5313054-a]OBC21142.1 hypothetical protein A5788_04610 [Gordonia sp. 852002-50816_SCH5313054-c]